MEKADRNLRRRSHPPHATRTARHLYLPQRPWKGEGGDLGGTKKILTRGGDNWEGTYEIGCSSFTLWSNVDGS
jgi:hypothetical protein